MFTLGVFYVSVTLSLFRLVYNTDQISVERLADVEVTLKGNSHYTVNTS